MQLIARRRLSAPTRTRDFPDADLGTDDHPVSVEDLDAVLEGTIMIRTPHRLTALLLVVVLSACSAGSDDATADPAASSESADVESTDVDSSDDESAAPAGRDENGYSLDPDCAAAEAANIDIRRDSGWLGNVFDETLVSSGGGGARELQPLIDAVAALRPFQDTETDFGTMREALDAIQSNIDAAQEGRYGDIEEASGIVVIGETVSIICS